VVSPYRATNRRANLVVTPGNKIINSSNGIAQLRDDRSRRVWPGGVSGERQGAAGLATTQASADEMHVVGVALTAVGAIAVYATSNQAGTTALLLIGAVFVIIGLQGTPLVRASKDSIELRGRRIAKKAKEIAGEGNPTEAENFVRGAIDADPRLSKAKSLNKVSADLYEISARHAVEKIAYEKGFLTEKGWVDEGRINLYLTARRADPLDTLRIDVAIWHAQAISYSALLKAMSSQLIVPILIVSNSPPSPRVLAHEQEIAGLFQWVHLTPLWSQGDNGNGADLPASTQPNDGRRSYGHGPDLPHLRRRSGVVVTHS
jgi:hypothetical protein